MICISSFRPLNDNAEYARNQLAAKSSWEAAFDWIIYINPESDDRLATPKTLFFQIEESYPTIKQMAEVAASQEGWCAIVNADIIIDHKIKAVEEKLNLAGAIAAFSFRYEFDPNESHHKGKVVDMGLDFFAAKPEVWDAASKLVQPDFRIGHQQWDTWILGFMASTCSNRLRNITNQKVVFHPKHGGRRFVYKMNINQKDPMFGRVGFGSPL